MYGEDCPFRMLGLRPGAGRKQVLRAWRRRVHNAGEDALLLARLNEAKERALSWRPPEPQRAPPEPGPGEQLRRQFEADTGVHVDDSRLDTLWEILTNDGKDAEESQIAREWMDRDRFKRDMFTLIYDGIRYL